jgi:hypothetical protein
MDEKGIRSGDLDRSKVLVRAGTPGFAIKGGFLQKSQTSSQNL